MRAYARLATALQALADLKGYSIRVFYAADIEQQVRSLNDPSLRKMVEQHFLRAPMAFPDAVINPLSKRSIPQDLFGFDDANAEAAVTLLATTLPALPTR